MSRNSRETCPSCGGEYEKITTHWAKSSVCEHPRIPSELMEVLRGMFATRGAIQRAENTPRYCVMFETRRERALKTTRRVFGTFGRNSITERTRSGTMWGQDVEGTAYQWGTITHPAINPSTVSLRETPSRLSAKGLVLVSGARVGRESRSRGDTSYYYIDATPEKAERAVEILLPLGPETSRSRPRGDHERVRVWVPEESLDDYIDVEWPSGWFNSR